jgi:hypothetical protein
VWARIRGIFGADANTEIARINREESQRNEEINRNENTSLSQVEARRRQRQNQIEAERQQGTDELTRLQEEERRAREQRMQDNLAAGQEELAQARREWEEAIGQAEGLAPAAQGRRGPSGRQLPTLEGLDSLARQKVDVQGTFNAMAVAGMGATSLAERAARASEQTATNTRRLVQMGQDGRLVFV